MIFEVSIPATCLVAYRVSANNAEDAKQRCLEGHKEPMDYNDWQEDNDSNNWRVQPID